MKKLAFMLVILTGCTTVNVMKIYPERDIFIHHEFKPFLKSFELVGLKYGRFFPSFAVTINLVDDIGNSWASGMCYYSDTGINEIRIRKAAWELMSDFDKEALIFHELGHCLLNRPHCAAETKKGTPFSIMHPYVVEGELWEKYRSFYMKELFEPSRKCI